ncbi:MAG: HAD family hydrolase [Peptococcaceae bacterium]|nr:HAD family hydrolase [Peptococcaceae bacterium]
MQYKGVIFDLDGTLIDSLEDIADALNAVLEKNGIQAHAYAEYRQFIGEGMNNLISKALPEKLRTEAWLSRLLLAMREEYRARCLDKTKPFAGMEELLRELSARGMKLAVLSNKIDELTKSVTLALFPGVRFEQLLGTSEETPRKPDPAGALRIVKQIGVAPADVIYVGDSGVDMKVANRAGFLPVGALWGYRTKEELLAEGAKHLIQHPGELLKLLEA